MDKDNIDAMRREWRKQYPHSHPHLTDPKLRAMLAAELTFMRTFRKQYKPDDPHHIHFNGYRAGFEAALRRMQDDTAEV